MNGYIGFWNGKRFEVQANTLWDAKLKVAEEAAKVAGRKKIKLADINVALAEVNGEAVIHRAVD